MVQISKSSKYTVYKPEGGDALVKSARYIIYGSPGYETFWAAMDTYLVDITWISVWSWENNSNAAHTYSSQCMTQLKVVEGSDVAGVVGIGAAFEALSVRFGSSTKTFSPYETTTPHTNTFDITIPPMTKLSFYQRRYTFRNKMFFILHARGKECNVGSRGGYTITRKECMVQIMSEDYLTVEVEMEPSSAGCGVLEVDTVPRAFSELRETSMYEHLTEGAWNELAKMGI